MWYYTPARFAKISGGKGRAGDVVNLRQGLLIFCGIVLRLKKIWRMIHWQIFQITKCKLLFVPHLYL